MSKIKKNTKNFKIPYIKNYPKTRSFHSKISFSTYIIFKINYYSFFQVFPKMHFSLKNIPQCKKNLKNQSPTLFLQKINHCLSLQTKNYQSKNTFCSLSQKRKKVQQFQARVLSPFFQQMRQNCPLCINGPFRGGL